MRILSEAFTRFPHLEVIDVDYYDDHIGSGELLRVLGSQCSECLQLTTRNYPNPCSESMLRRDTEYTAFVIFRALQASDTQLVVLQLGCHEDFVGSESQYLPRCFFADYEEVNPCFLPDLDYDSIFSRLRELRVGAKGFQRCGYNTSLSQKYITIRFVLRSASLLEVVRFEELDDSFGNEPTSLGSLFEGVTLRHLRHLDVSGTQTQPDCLVDLFQRHGSTLVEVHLRHLYRDYGNEWDSDDDEFGEGFWSPFLGRLRKMAFPCLKVFTITECDEHEDELELQDYVLCKTEVDPLAQERERTQ